MKILIIRHAEPDYTIDSITEKGKREAQFLAERISELNPTAFFVSPLGRARDTAKYSLEKCGKNGEIKDWLIEFDTLIYKNEIKNRCHPWDRLPDEWTEIKEYFDKDKWYNVPVMAEAKMKDAIERVYNGVDETLKNFGYERYRNYYKAVKPNEDTIAFFCHFGVECVILSHLLNLPLMPLWHGFIALPSSVTTICTEERKEGIAYFRASSLGDISHLYKHGEEPSFAGRFCETFYNTNQRH